MKKEYDVIGDANAVSPAGFLTFVPEETQPATLSWPAAGYETDIEAEKLKIRDVQHLLQKHGAIVPELTKKER